MPLRVKIICPLCSMNRPEEVFESNEENAYGTWTEDRPIIQVRDAPGGKASDALVGTGKYRKSPGRGFPVVNTFIVGEAKDMPEYSGYMKQISEQLVKVAKIFRSQGLISDEDVDSIRAG